MDVEVAVGPADDPCGDPAVVGVGCRQVVVVVGGSVVVVGGRWCQVDEVVGSTWPVCTGGRVVVGVGCRHVVVVVGWDVVVVERPGGWSCVPPDVGGPDVAVLITLSDGGPVGVEVGAGWW